MLKKYLKSWVLQIMKLLIEGFKALDKKLKIVGIIFVVAVVFVLIPTSGTKKSQIRDDINLEAIKRETEKNLSVKLSKIIGVEKAEIVITYENDGVYEYQTDDKSSLKTENEDGKKTSHQTQLEKKTVFDGGKNTIIKTRKMPEIKGVCIFYSGENSDLIHKSLYSATKGSLGVELHKIEVINIK